MWESLPESKEFSKKRRKTQQSLPVPDSVITSSFLENSMSSGVVTAKATVISKELDRLGVLSVVPSVHPAGYLTQLDSALPSHPQEINDLKKIKLIINSLISTHPEQPEGWLAASRVEEKQGNSKGAREILAQGCGRCPHAEEL